MYYGNPSADSTSNITNTFIRVIDGNQSVKGSWHFDEGSGTTAYDSSGNENNGSLVNDPTWANGKFGKAIQFDGVDDYVQVNYRLSTPITIAAWVNLPDFTHTLNTLLNTYPHPVIIISLNRLGMGETYVYIGSGSGWIGVPSIISNQSLEQNKWHYVVYTNDGTMGVLYHDGVNVGSSSHVPSGYGDFFWLGAATYAYPSVGEPFTGFMDEVSIYNRALSTAEISDLYNNYGYTTTNYPGRVLVRKYASSEPTASLGSESSVTGGLGGILGKGTSYGLTVKDELISTDTWTHLALTYNGTYQKLYIMVI